MNRRSFLGFLITAPITRALPWNAIAKICPPVRRTLDEIVAVTIAENQEKILANMMANNALLRQLDKQRIEGGMIV